MSVHLFVLLLSLLSQSVGVIAGFPFIAVVPPLAGWVVYQASDFLQCLVIECCAQAVNFSSSRFHEDLKYKLHGQHIAVERLYSHVKAHMEDPNPRKALVLSLHGFTGVGKNYASSIIVSNILRKGENSRFYHFYDSTIHFPHKDLVDEYKDPDNRWGLHFPNLRLYFTAFLMTMFLSTVYIKPLEKEYVFKQIFLLTKLQSDVRNAVSSCGVSIFVFDEVHKMPPGVLNALVPFLGFSQSIDGVDYRRSIFIFLGNSGGTVINEYLLEAISQGKKRSSIQYGDMRRNLAKVVFNEKGALEFSNLISEHLITALVPFLPLQEVHVRQCIADAAERMYVEATEEMKDFVVDELDWGPNDMHIFSESGCKLIYEKVGFYLQHSGLTKEPGDDNSIQKDDHAP